MLPAVMALCGVVVGVALCLAAGMLTDRRRERSRGRRDAAATKQATYQRTLQGLDGLLTMRSDHPDLGLAVRAVTADITQLRLIAPAHIGELADMCVQAMLQAGGDPNYPAQVRAHFIDAVRGDLLGGQPTTAARLTLPAATTERGSRQARHAKPRRA